MMYIVHVHVWMYEGNKTSISFLSRKAIFPFKGVHGTSLSGQKKQDVLSKRYYFRKNTRKYSNIIFIKQMKKE